MLLAKNRGRVFSKEQIYDMVWNNEYVYDGRNMTAYINKIRRKIEPNPARPRYILTVWGVGYKFNGEIEPADNVE
ncbi:MAG: winged helix-turn-helix domain-containing protein [Lachnospiraceae bacterium]|nr:winged helix-turn-helix domain-containing protein [Lachnospiraceae bacterium]